MVGQGQEAAVELAFLAREDGLDDGLGVVVDHALRDTAKEGEGPVVGVEDHFLGLPGVGGEEELPAVGEAEVGELDGLHHTAQFHLFMAPVELGRLPRRETQGDVGVAGGGGGLALPVLHVTLDAVVGAGIALALEVFVQPPGGAPLGLGTLAVLLQPGLQLLPVRPKLGTGLLAALVGRFLFGLEVLLDGVARQVQVAGDVADRFLLDQVPSPQLHKTLHADHSRLLRQKGGILTQPGWSKLHAVYTGCLVRFAR
jgi:hypothetical protein